MDSGSHPLSSRESLLRRIQFQLIVTRRVQIRPVDWQLDLCSPFCRIYVNECDGGSIAYRNKRLTLDAGKPCFIPAWLAFRTNIELPIVQNYIHFDFLGFPHSLTSRLFSAPALLDDPLTLSAAREWLDFLRTGDEPVLSLVTAASALVHVIMTRLFLALDVTRQTEIELWLDHAAAIGPALELIDQRLSRPPSNEELARVCHSSVAHFSRKFQAAVGMAPSKYGRVRRLAVAAQMLQQNDQSIEHIAEATGFVDRFHFSRAFKSHLGLPPSAYRNARNA